MAEVRVELVNEEHITITNGNLKITPFGEYCLALERATLKSLTYLNQVRIDSSSRPFSYTLLACV